MTITHHDGLVTITATFDPISLFLIVSALIAFLAGHFFWKEGFSK